MSQSNEVPSSFKKSWEGTSISEICKGKGFWSFAISPMVPSKFHWVLFDMPVDLKTPPRPHVSKQPQLWVDDHVRMPYSESNLFPVKEDDMDVIKLRWELIKKAFSNPIRNSHEFETAVQSYNTPLQKFDALHYYFEETMEEDMAEQFFSNLLPEIISLALRLPELLPSGIPLLQQNHNRSLSLSQLQIACLLANAFLCTFPWKKTVASSYPGVNFVRLFSAVNRPNRHNSIEKLKCIFNYFRRVTRQNPVGVVTFERKFIRRSNMPRWDKEDNYLGNTRVHITSTGTIEDAQGFLQVDFANKNIGGGVLGYGCVQEEIRFVICPELIISRLFVEQLNNGEAVIITGIERFNNYAGYGETFEWTSDYLDETPYDIYGRRRTSICVIDATSFHRPKDQFNRHSILREVNKAFVGFSSREKKDLAPVATGNWGCGAFRGSKELKSVIQLMACCAAGRDLVYYSFGDEELVDSFYKMYLFLANNQITIAQLWKYLGQFCSAHLAEDKLFAFIQQAHFDYLKQPSIKTFFAKTESNKFQPGSSKIFEDSKSPKKSKTEKFENDDMDIQQFSSDEDVIDSSQPELLPSKRIIIKPKNKFNSQAKSPVADLSSIFDLLDQCEKVSGESEPHNNIPDQKLDENNKKSKNAPLKPIEPTEDLTDIFDILDGKIPESQNKKEKGQQLSVLLSPELNKVRSKDMQNNSLQEVVIVKYQNDQEDEKMDEDTKVINNVSDLNVSEPSTSVTDIEPVKDSSKSTSNISMQSKISKKITDYFTRKP